MKVFVVVPNWNGEDLLAECLESLQAQSYDCTVVVVDNGSADGSVEIVESKFPKAVLLKNEKNLGFAGGVNTGLRYGLENGADAIALFNNDAVAEKDWLKKLVESMDDHIGIVTGKLMRSDRKYLDSTGDFYTIYGVPFPRGRNQKDEGQYEKAEEVFGATGGASLYKAEMLKEIGSFDERFFAYFEDVDISFRAQLAGWKIWYQPKAVAYHHVSATSSKLGKFARYHSIKNLLMLYTKDMPAGLYWKYMPYFFYQFLRTTARSIIDLEPLVWLRAVLAFTGFLPGLLKERRKIQKNRKISVDEVEKLLYKARPPKIPNY